MRDSGRGRFISNTETDSLPEAMRFDLPWIGDTLSPPPVMRTKPERYGSVLRLRPERLEEYKREHEAVWPEVLSAISNSHIRNYSIYHHEGWLFSYLEYWGEDFAADMAQMATDPATQRWWAFMEPMQDPLPSRAPGEWWARMEEVFHHN